MRENISVNVIKVKLNFAVTRLGCNNTFVLCSIVKINQAMQKLRKSCDQFIMMTIRDTFILHSGTGTNQCWKTDAV